MKRWILTLALFVVVAIGAYQWRFGNLGLRNPASLSGNTCEGRDFCVSVYMAPWCPHCKTAMPMVQSLLAKTQHGGKTGVRVVIGMAEPAQSEAMGNSIAKNVVFDHDSRIAKELNVQGVPSFKVLDKEGTVIIDGPEARMWINEKFGG